MASTKIGTTQGGKALQTKRRYALRTMTTATQLCTLPRGSVILGFLLSGTASDAATTATLSLGSTTTSNEYVSAFDVKGSGSGNRLLAGVTGAIGKVPAGNIPNNSNMPIWAKYAETGTASTVGDWVVTVLYTTGNDTFDTAA